MNKPQPPQPTTRYIETHELLDRAQSYMFSNANNPDVRKFVEYLLTTCKIYAINPNTTMDDQVQTPEEVTPEVAPEETPATEPEAAPEEVAEETPAEEAPADESPAKPEETRDEE